MTFNNCLKFKTLKALGGNKLCFVTFFSAVFPKYEHVFRYYFLMVKLIDIKVTLVVDQKKSCSGQMDDLGVQFGPQIGVSSKLWIISKDFSKILHWKGLRDTWVHGFFCFFFKSCLRKVSRFGNNSRPKNDASKRYLELGFLLKDLLKIFQHGKDWEVYQSYAVSFCKKKILVEVNWPNLDLKWCVLITLM